MKNLFEERVVEVCDELAREEWSISASVKMEETRKEMCKADPKRLHMLIGEYDDLVAGLHCKTIDRVYLQGFKDAIILMKF